MLTNDKKLLGLVNKKDYYRKGDNLPSSPELDHLKAKLLTQKLPGYPNLHAMNSILKYSSDTQIRNLIPSKHPDCHEEEETVKLGEKGYRENQLANPS